MTASRTLTPSRRASTGPSVLCIALSLRCRLHRGCLSDSAALERVAFVMKNGVVVRRMEEPRSTSRLSSTLFGRGSETGDQQIERPEDLRPVLLEIARRFAEVPHRDARELRSHQDDGPAVHLEFRRERRHRFDALLDMQRNDDAGLELA